MKKIYTILVFTIFISGCTMYSKLPRITHVIGIAENGDTIRIPINELRPKYIYNFNNRFPYFYGRYYPYINYWNDYYDHNYNRWNNNIYYNGNGMQYTFDSHSSSLNNNAGGGISSATSVFSPDNGGGGQNYGGTQGVSNSKTSSGKTKNN